MKKLFPVLLLLLVAILATIPLIPVLSDTDQVLAFNDGNIEAGLRPSNQYPEIFTSRYDNQFFFGRALAPREIKAITTFQCLLGPHQYRRVGPIFILALSALDVASICALTFCFCLRRGSLNAERLLLHLCHQWSRSAGRFAWVGRIGGRLHGEGTTAGFMALLCYRRFLRRALRL